MELKDSTWTEPSFNIRGLKCPGSIQPGILEFNPKTGQTTTIGKFSSMEPEICYPGSGVW